LEVQYEELLRNGPEVLRAVFEFVGTVSTRERTEAIYEAHGFEAMKDAGTGAHGFLLPKEFFRKGEAGGWRDVLTPGERYIFNEMAGDLLCALGYSDPRWCYDHVYQRFTVPLLAMVASPRRTQAKVRTRIKRILNSRQSARGPTSRAQEKTVEVPADG
jgi:hypothetical protein